MTARARGTAVVVAILLAACGSGGASHPSARPLTGLVTFDTDTGSVSTVDLQLARTPEARARGLMGQRTLVADSGMLFLFPKTTREGFWMKDTVIPLSVAFFDEHHRIVDILEMQPCRTGSCTVHRPDHTYTAALEMHLGWFARHGVRIGDRVDVQLFAS